MRKLPSITLNEGSLDRLLRASAAIALGLLAALSLNGLIQIIVAIAAIFLAVTALSGFCGVYNLLGIKTCKLPKKLKNNPVLDQRSTTATVAILTILGSGLITGLVATQDRWPLAPLSPGTLSCTQEALLCPNQSGVGRSGPNCSFDVCSFAKQSTSDWQVIKRGVFTASIPRNWKVTAQQLNNGEVRQTILTGPEGQIIVSNGRQPSEKCSSTWGKLRLSSETLEGCLMTEDNGTLVYKQFRKQLRGGPIVDLSVYIQNGTERNHNLVSTILSSLELSN